LRAFGTYFNETGRYNQQIFDLIVSERFEGAHRRFGLSILCEQLPLRLSEKI
jgi:hypothetical protein